MIEIRDETYRRLARLLLEAIGPGDFYNGRIAVEEEAFEGVLRATLIVYRRRELFPEGERDTIRDVVPVWWEFSTRTDRGEVLNDFTFRALRAHLHG